MTEEKKNILIVEDHELTRFGLRTNFEGIDIVNEIYEAADAEQALKEFKSHHVDLIIMDLGLPNVDGIEITKRIRLIDNEVKIIILTSHNDEKAVLNSLKAGANAYCSKEINLKTLENVVKSVLDGAAWFDPSIAHIVLRAATSQDSAPSGEVVDFNLTQRELQILKLIAKGYSNIEIAKECTISINTIKAHVASILQKLEVDDRLQAALKAIKYQIV